MLAAIAVESCQRWSFLEHNAGARSLGLSPSISIRLAVPVYAVVFGAAGVLDYVGFRSAGYDVGTAAQAIWNTAHGRPLEATAAGGEQFLRLGWHVDPLLLLFAPIWLIWSSPLILIVVLAVAVSAGALPVYWLAQKHLRSDRAALCFALAYLAYPATQWNALDPNLGFNPVSLALPLLLYALWWLDEERWVRFGIVAFLAATCNEHIPVVVGCLGLWYGVTRRRPIFGGAMLAAGLAVTVVEFLYVVPHFSTTRSNPFADRYAAIGGTAGGVVKAVLLHPLRAVDVVLSGHKLVYVALLFVPLLGLCFRAPLLLLAAIPPLGINLLSSSPDMTEVWSHYAATTAAVLFGAAILGAARLKRDPRLVSGAVLVAVAATAVISPFWTALPVAREAIGPSARVRAERHAVGLIPGGVPVSASNRLGSHLSNRRSILLFPAIRDARWIAVDTADAEGPVSFRDAVERLRHGGGFTTVYESDGVVVLRRSRTVDGVYTGSRHAGGTSRFPQTPSTGPLRFAHRTIALRWAILDSNQGPPPYQSGALTD